MSQKDQVIHMCCMAISELGDLLYSVNEIISFTGNNANEIALTNIEKLKQRYPYGFDKAKSLNRK